MSFEFNLVYALWALLGLLVGLVIGNATWGRAARRHARVADSVVNAAAAAAARNDAQHSARELEATREQIRPLADEIDRLKRDLAKARRAGPTETLAAQPLASQPLAAQPLAAQPLADSPNLSDAAAVDIRQLKGVGDKFAAALAAVGLGSVARLAHLSAGDAAEADTKLGVFNGRIGRDRLVEQAELLEQGRTTEYETRFGKLGGPIL